MTDPSPAAPVPTSMWVARRVPLIVACALFMENLDSTIIATALPQIARSLDEDPLHLSLAITAYLLSLSVFIPLSGWLADRYGARRVFRNAIVIFVLGSVACAASQSIAHLVLARVLQGLGGALMVPVGRLVLLREVPKSELVGAMSYLTVPALLAPVFGPPLGGLIATYASWHWIFLVNVPIGVLGFWLVSRFIPDTKEESVAALDLAGWAMVGLGVAGIVFGFENLGKHVLPQRVAWATLGIGALLLGMYAHHAMHDRSPILSLKLLRVPTFRVSVGGGSLFRIGVGSVSLLLPMMLQIGYGLSALESGSITFAGALGALFMKTLAPRLTRRYGFRPLLVVNGVACSLMLAATGWLSPDYPLPLVLAFLLFTGFLRSLQFTCVNAMAYSDVHEETMSQATSFSGTAQQLALSLGVGIASQVLNLSLMLRHGTTLEVADFRTAFCVMGAISLLAFLSFRRLAPEAGNAVSGNRLAVANEPQTTASD